MKVAKKTAEYTIFQRRDNRYAVCDTEKKWVNGDDKVKILMQEGLMKKPEPKAAKPDPEAVEGGSEETSAES